jgi:putative spermidine/putrescine transport system substrate-binding protein
MFAMSFIGCKAAEEPAAEEPAAEEPAEEAVSEPLPIEILDVSGEEPMIKASIEQFVEENPDLVSELSYLAASGPEVATKIQAQQKAGNLTITMVTMGYEGLGTGVKQGIYQKLWPDYKEEFEDMVNTFTEDGLLGLEATGGYGIPHVSSPGGPMFSYNPDKISPEDVPTNCEELLEFAKANPGKFSYPRPNNSGAGYEFLMGLPYLLGEEEPAGDPENWTKVWPYLQELDKYIDYYTTGSAIAYKELADGIRWMLPVHVGYDTYTRVMGIMPLNFKHVWFENTHWVLDTNSLAIPVGLDEQRFNIAVKLINFVNSPEQQIYTFDGGFMYPCAIVKGVTLDQAPEEEREKLEAVVTDDVKEAIEKYPKVMPLEIDYLIKMFDLWDKYIGAGAEFNE